MSICRFTLIIICCILSVVTQAQQATVVTGKVDGPEGPVPGASVSIPELSISTQTSNDGSYKLSGIQPGRYTLLISAIGYTSVKQRFEIVAGAILTLHFTLRQRTREMDTVTVVGKSVVQQLRESPFTVNALETKRFANATADLNQVLNRTSGIRVREQGGVGSDYNFSINGLSGKAVRFFVDGVPLEIMGSAMSLNNIPVNLAERIEVYKGVVPIDLGADALGGAVNVVTGTQAANYLDASYSYGSFNTSRAALNGQYVHQPTGLLVKTSAFYNRSDNDYLMRGVEIWDENEYDYVAKNFKRFHDRYHSAMGQLEAGFVDRKWADAVFASFAYSGYDQELQTGVEQQIVYGDVTRKGHGMNASLRYRKNDFLAEGLNVNLFASRSGDYATITDTAMYKYEWDGSRAVSSRAEMGGSRSLVHISRPRTYARGNATYALDERHSFNVNYTADLIKNSTYDEMIEDGDDVPSYLDKHMAGLAYQQRFWDGRLSNIFFGKYYGIGIAQSRILSFDTDGSIIYQRKDDFFSHWGYGLASKYDLLPGLGIKASFEHAYRLQEAEEMFGNGYNTVPNLDLKPEGSDNINVGVFVNRQVAKHHFFAEASWFYRDANDFIYYVPNSRRYENKSSVRVDGLEGELRYTYGQLFSFLLNASYQHAINTTKFSRPGSSTPEITYLNRIPNQPWLFGNVDFSIGKDNVWGQGSRLQFNWYTQYVHWFYLSWESFGNISSNSVIPDQYIHNAVLTYSFQQGKYNLSLECRNLTDNLAYDNFRLQKPGRTVSAKVRYFIK